MLTGEVVHEPVAAARCLEPDAFAAVQFTASNMPMAQVSLETTPVPHQEHIGFHTQGPPVEAAVVVACACPAILFFYWWSSRNPGSAIRRAFAHGAAFAGLFAICGIVLPWAALVAGQNRMERGDYRGSIELMRQAADPLEIASRWVEEWRDNPALEIAEAASFAGIRDALAVNDLAAAVEYARWPRATSTQGRRASAAVFAMQAGHHLTGGNLLQALEFAKLAAAAAPELPSGPEGVAIIRAHLVLDAMSRSQFQEAREHLRPMPRTWRTHLQASFLSEIAHRRVVALFDQDATRIDAQRAILEEAWSEVTGMGRDSLQLRCDLAGTYELFANRSLIAEDAAAAVTYLERVEQYVVGSDLTDALWPVALHQRGIDEIGQRRGADAVRTLELALSRKPEDPSVLEPTLVNALLLRTQEELDQARTDEALATANRAHGIRPSEATEDAISWVRVTLGQRALRCAHWSRAREELLAARSNERFITRTSAALAEMAGAPYRIARINRASRWVTMPATVVGEQAVDSDEDGIVDAYQYGDGNCGALGWAQAGQPSAVSLTPAGLSQAFLRDSNGDGEFDQYTAFTGANSSSSVMDIDYDSRPDLIVDFQDGKVTREQPLSGRVLFVVVGAVIGGEPVDAPGAGESDTYFTVTHNSIPPYRSGVVADDRFPSFSEGTVIEYKYGDVVSLAFADEDLVFDDPLGDVSWNTLPQSGTAMTSNGRVAVMVRSEPSSLPVAHRYIGPQELNVFRDPRQFPPHSAIGALVASAHRLEADTEVRDTFARIAVNELLVTLIAPRARALVQLGIAIGLDLTVGEALWPSH